MIKYSVKTNSIADTHITSLNTYSSKTNSDAITLLNSQSTIKSDKTAISNAGLDVTSQQLSLTKVQNTLADAKSALLSYYIYAPFTGVVGAVSVKKGDTISSGTSAITFITQNQMTAISLSETDIPKIKLGDKAILTFDAISDLSITGKVTEIDTIGTVSQGVVNYNVKIIFDTQDERIKPGMSISASIITDIQQDVLSVPNSAVKTKNGSSYVLVLSQKQDLTSSTAIQGFVSAVAPTQKPVQIGLADNTNTQIISGLSEGDQVVVRSIASTATTSATSASAIPGLTGGAVRVNTGGGGGNFRPGG
ncbi:MAG: efflux RND transporter periplasmic adaptor subunit [Candidatus Staskawiczbacteria bacterium]|nr:efflux RND transporter periplasmic adaptor subunit [Candidatus Staskawiczbacteria bacterium]